jgi:hypothetical protein
VRTKIEKEETNEKEEEEGGRSKVSMQRWRRAIFTSLACHNISEVFDDDPGVNLIGRGEKGREGGRGEERGEDVG